LKGKTLRRCNENFLCEDEWKKGDVVVSSETVILLLGDGCSALDDYLAEA
jgi:hypothetical protein